MSYPGPFYPGFKNAVKIKIFADVLMKGVIRAPAGDRIFDANQQVTGFEVLDYCLFCNYVSNTVTIEVDGLSKRALEQSVAMTEVRNLN